MGKWPWGQEKGRWGKGPGQGLQKRSTDPSQVEQNRGFHVSVCLSECLVAHPRLPSHIYPAQPHPTSVIPVAKCPWPPRLPPTSYSTRLSSTVLRPQNHLLLPLPRPCPSERWISATHSQAPSPLLPSTPFSSLLPSHPLNLLPSEALGREEAYPQSGKEATGAARTSQRET